jgi:hypothetical protein
MQLKMGGKCHLRLNIEERPIANKYREGKMKRNSEKRVKQYVKLPEGKGRKSDMPLQIQPCLWTWCIFVMAGQRRFVPPDIGLGNVALPLGKVL